MPELCDESALTLRRALGAREISALELLESCLERIATLNGTLNAFVALDAEGARAAARAADAALARGERPGLLHGLPVGIKDLADTAGLRTTYGSPLYAQHVPEADDWIVARLRAEGAIVVGKTNTPEFGAGSNTVNPVYGATRNPFEPRRTPGGSSGGSAVAVATAMVPLAHGSDSGGSLRAPATWCGIVSIRPTPGVVPGHRRGFPYTHFSVEGPMARTVADVALGLEAMRGGRGEAGFDPADPLSAPAGPPFHPLPEVDLAGLRVAASADLGCAPVEQGIRATFRDRVERLASRFRSLEWADPPLAGAREIFWTLRGLHFVAAHGERYRRHRERLGPNIVTNVEAGLALTPEEIGRAHLEWGRLYRAFEAWMEAFDLLLVPGNATPPFLLEEGIPRAIDGRPLENYMDASLVRSALTLTGHPIVALPSGLDHADMPFGFQVVGPRRGDRFTLAAARALERALAVDPELRPPVPPR